MQFLWGLVGFLCVGLSLGLLGGGGSILAVPILVHVLGIPLATAVPMSMPVVGTTAALAAWSRWRQGQLRLRLVATIAICAMAAAFVAARLGHDLDDRPRTILLAATMLTAATAMLLRARAQARRGEAPRPAESARTIVIIPSALAAGTLTGLVGVGGGFLVVPVLTGFLGIGMAEASATALAVIALNTGAAGLGYIGEVSLDWRLTAMITVAAIIGMTVGTRLSKRVKGATLSRMFALLLVVVGVFMIWEDFRG